MRSPRRTGPRLLTLLLAAVMFRPLPAWSEDTVEKAPDMGTTWAAHWSRHELEESLSLFAPDAVFIGPQGSVSGTAALRTLLRDALQKFEPAIRMTRRAFGQSGDLAYESGEYDETVLLSGQRTRVRGSYLMVLRRDGTRWLIQEQMWSGPQLP